VPSVPIAQPMGLKGVAAEKYEHVRLVRGGVYASDLASSASARLTIAACLGRV